jgi:hypothetical protein
MGETGDIVVLRDPGCVVFPFCNWLRICAVELLLLSLYVEAVLIQPYFILTKKIFIQNCDSI